MSEKYLNRLADGIRAFFKPNCRPAGQGGLTERLAWFSKPRPQVLVELFVAFCLAANFFWLVRPQCLPKQHGNVYPALTFSYLSGRQALTSDLLRGAWRTRVLAPAVSGWFLDTQVHEVVGPESAQYQSFHALIESAEFQKTFGLYHATWLFLLFLAVVVFRRDALLLMLGIFGGLMYNLTASAGAYYYPWDMPAMFFFTLACLLHDRCWFWLLLPVVLLGGLFKETVLCCSLFILLGGQGRVWQRIAGFLAVILGTLAINHLLMAHVGAPDRAFAMNNAGTFGDLLHNTLLSGNVTSLFHPGQGHVIFANAGALFLMMLLPWRSRRDVVLKLVVVAFAVGQFFYGIINEVRVWYELLPVGWMLLGENIKLWQSEPSAVEAQPAAGEQISRWLKVAYWPAMGTLLLVALGVFVQVRLNPPPLEPGVDTPETVLRKMAGPAEAGDAGAQFKLALAYERLPDYDNAILWYRRSAEQGHPDAQYKLGLLLANIRRDEAGATQWYRQAADRGHPEAQYDLGVICWNQHNYQEAFQLFSWSAQQGQKYAQWMLGTLYLKASRPDLVEAYKWLKLSRLQEFSPAQKELETCLTLMTPEQIAEAEKEVEQFPRPTGRARR